MRDVSKVLSLVKADLIITSDARDLYFQQLIGACIDEIEAKGIPLDLNKTEDLMLVSDFSAWRYRKRAEGAVMPENLKHRLRNKIVKSRAKQEVQS